MKKVMGIILGMVALLFADLQVGDTVKYYMDIFRLILTRDTIPRKGVVRYVGKNFYLVSGDKVSVTKIVKRNHKFYLPDSFAYLAGTKRIAGKNPEYAYVTTDLIKWSKNTALSGRDGTVDYDSIRKINTYDLDIYDIAPNPHPNAVNSYSSVYIASSDGLFALSQAMTVASDIALRDTAVFSVVFHPDSSGPLPFAQREVLFIGTQKGVYRVRVNSRALTNPESLAQYSRMGNLTDSVFAVGVDPNNANTIYAATLSKLYKWNPSTSSWDFVKDLPGKPHRIKFFDSQKILITTKKGIFYSQDGGVTWQQFLSDFDVWEIEYCYGYYWAATDGNGVLRSTSISGTWEEVNEGLNQMAAIGAKSCHTIFYDSKKDRLLLGNDQGVWKWEQNKWVNVSKGVGSIIPDAEVVSIAKSIEDPFNNGKNLFDSLKTILKVEENELWDIDNDPHIYVVLTGIIYSSDLKDPTLTPIYGYFDPYNEEPSNPYSNKKEIFFVDLSYFYTPQGEINTFYLARFLGYLFNLYALWSVERNEAPALREGLAIDALHLAGFKVFGDTVGIQGGRQWASSVDRLNMPLLSYTTAWLNSPVAREMDRERVGYFIEYIRERFGDEIFYEIMRDKINDSYDALKSAFEKRGYKFEDVFSDWVIANLIDNTRIEGGKYGYKDINNIFDYGTPSQYSKEIPDSAIAHSVVSPAAVTYWLSQSNTPKFTHFDLQDNFGTPPSGFRLYKVIYQPETTVIKFEFDTLYKYAVVGNDTIVIIKRARNVISDSAVGKVMYVVVNTTKSLTGKFACSFEKLPPYIYSSYILQNPVVSHSLDFYVLSKKELYGDADHTSSPDIFLVPLNKNMSKVSSSLSFMQKGDSVYIYNASITLPKEVEGDVVVYSYAQDLVGLDKIIYYDTISVRKISGGSYSFFNGELKIEIPENIQSQYYIIVSRIPSTFTGIKDESIVGKVYSIGHSGICFPQKIKIIIRNPEIFGKEDLSLYRYENGKWIECETYLSLENGEIIAYTDKLGIFAIRGGSPFPIPKEFNFVLKTPNILSINSVLQFEFSLPFKSDVSILIYDVSGRNVYSKNLNSLSPGIYNYKLSLKSEISKGVYVMRFNAESKNRKYTKTLKLVLF
jgi:hypothetical protein